MGRGYRPALEVLEERRLPSQVTGPALKVARAATAGLVSAGSDNGLSVVAWANGSGRRVQAQLVAPDGHPLGRPITVTRDLLANGGTPAVAMDARGDFIVVWGRSYNGTSRIGDIAGQLFAPTGARAGVPFTIAGAPFDRTSPHVAMTSGDDFVVTYQTTYDAVQGGPRVAALPPLTSDLHAALYHGRAVRSLLVTQTSGATALSSSAVASAADGSFTIAYATNSVPSTSNALQGDVVVKRYAADGTLLGTRTVAHNIAAPTHVAVAMDERERSTVAYDSIDANTVDATRLPAGVYAVRVNPSGSVSPTVTIDPAGQLHALAVDAHSGNSLVAWSHPDDVQLTEVTPANRAGRPSALGAPLRQAALSTHGPGQFLAAFGTNLTILARTGRF